MRSKTLLWIAGAVAALLPVACNKNGTDKPAASQMQISVKARRNAAGVTVPFAFSATDAFKLVDVTSGSSDIREPMNKGLPQSFFVFSLGKAAVGDLLVAYSPVDAPVEIEGSSVSFRIPENQDGSDIIFPYIGWTKYSGDSYAGDAISAESHAAVIRASIQKGSYSVVKAVLKANGGEKIAGKVTVDTGSKRYTPSAAEVTVTLPSPLDCRSASQSVPFFVAPVNLAGGTTLTFFTDDGKQVESKVSTPVNLSSGAVFDTDPASVGRQLIAAGGTKVYIFDEKMARDAGNYKAGLVWESTRVKIRSTAQISALRAGIKLPIWVMSTSRATCRMYVDLPAMLGPVMITIRSSVEFNVTLLGTKISLSRSRSTTGWRPSRIRISPLLFSSGRW